MLKQLLSTSAEVIEEVSKPFQGLLSTYGLISIWLKEWLIIIANWLIKRKWRYRYKK